MKPLVKTKYQYYFLRFPTSFCFIFIVGAINGFTSSNRKFLFKLGSTTFILGLIQIACLLIFDFFFKVPIEENYLVSYLVATPISITLIKMQEKEFECDGNDTKQ